jgi:hypothetical protein
VGYYVDTQPHAHGFVTGCGGPDFQGMYLRLRKIRSLSAQILSAQTAGA